MAQDLLRSGALARSTASTSMNAHSSRSHAICTLTMEHHEIAVAEGGTETRFSKFHLVDLAGSERVRRTNSEGARFKEGVNINRGLLALGNVINALWERKQTKPMTAHVPYRDSKLTRLLQDSLGGNSKTLMIACISPSDVNYEETSNTLRYASRTRNIENVAVVNKERSAENEVAHLKQQLEIVQLQLLQQKHGMVKGPLRIEAQNSSVCEENTVLSGGALEEENRNLKQELLAANAATDKWKKIAGDLMDKSKMESQPSQLRTPTPKKLNVASGQREQGSKSGPPCRLEQLRHFQSQKGKALLRKEGADAKRKAEDVALIASKRNRTLASPIPNTPDAIRTSVMGRKKKVPPAPITRSKVGEPISSEVTKLVQQVIASQEATISAKEAVRVNLADRKVLAHTITQLEALSTAENTETLAKLQNDLRSKTANIRLLQQKLARIEKTTSLPSGLFPSKLETCHELIRYLVEILIECKEECLDFSNCRADLSEAKDKIVTIQETHRKKMHRMETKLEVTKKELEALQMQASKKNTDKKRKARESYETMETLFSSSDEEEDNSEADSDYVDEDDQRKGRKRSSKKKSLKIARNVDVMDEIDELLETSTATCCSCHGMCATKACACKSQNRDCSSQCPCNSTKCRNRECSDAPGTSDDTRLSDESIEDIDQTSPSTPQRGDATAVSSSATDESNLMAQDGAARVIDFMSP
ncbi:unnamed protein product [Phytophthora lilii]|uniref:Kinesin-like protein n=1 Tax=Phytophthora lilii TaxID=2077276 RepID=A0A9W6TUQ5_9STRA|nr:unnamed protein product [Phytophthora lilii]